MIIGIAERSDVGKDIVARIIQELKMGHSTSEIKANMKNLNTAKYDTIRREDSSFEVKRFSDKLKDIVCILLSCTREQLEDEEFLNKDLGEEWTCWKYEYMDGDTLIKEGISITKPDDELEFEDCKIAECYSDKVVLTPRILLELLRTECGEQIVHPNIWVNALFMDYKSELKIIHKLAGEEVDEDYEPHEDDIVDSFPNWIITDVEFPNQVQAIKDRNGVVIQVDNSSENIEELIEEVRTILIDLKIIK